MYDAPLAALEQAARLAGPGATVQAVRALAGGTGARTSLIRTANPEIEVVLREFPPGDDEARREARVLRVLGGLDGLAPRLLASDIADASSGASQLLADDGADTAARGSWLLISRMPGTADITPRRPVAQAGQLGQVLARIHQTPVDRLAELPSALSQAGGSLAGLSGPAADVAAANWDIVAGTPSVLVHYDFWSGNVVWQDEVLSGVVDWTGGCLGPPGFDIGLRAVVPGLADSVLPE